MSWNIDKPIIVPFDFSVHSLAAVERAVQLAERPSDVHVLNVLPFMTPTEPGVVWGAVDDGDRIRHTLDAMQETLADDKYAGVSCDVRLGDAGSVTSQRAEELDAALVVVGSHGRTGLSRMLLGSVAERVARMAHCPVLIVKLPEAATEEAGKDDKQASAGGDSSVVVI